MYFVLNALQIIACIVSVSAIFRDCRDPLQEYRECQSSSCVKTCENPNPIVCTLDCQRGCYCKEPYVRDKSTNRCVKINDCTSLCRANEEYKTCGYCDSTCEGPAVKCTRNCMPGCYCKDGYVRNQGSCIKVDVCRNYG